MDGADAPILEANYMFRAIALEAGRHEVEFRYRPASVGIGAGISLVAGLLLLLVHRRARRPLPRALP